MLTTISDFFKLQERNTTWRTEIIAGSTTFLTMVYIAMVNPAILAIAGIAPKTAFAATCLVAAFASILCGLLSNFPIALAPSMGLNAYFTFSVIKSGQMTLGQALACVFIAGVVFFLLTLFRIRNWLLKAIPPSLCHALGAGIGLFIGFIGLKQLGIVVSQPNTLVTLGNIASLPILFSFFGFCLMIILDEYKIPGAILISILLISFLGTIFNLNHFHDLSFQIPQLQHYFQIFNFHDLTSAHGVMIIFTFLLVALFDSTGTFLSLLYQAGLASDQKIMHRISQAFYAESLATMFASFVGVSTIGPYVENAAGIAAGGKTGLTSIVVGIYFLLILGFASFAADIPVFAYAPALLFIAFKMSAHLSNINWRESSEGVPAILILLLIPLTFSIANGIACGFILYVIIQIACKKWKNLHFSSWVLFAVFITYLAMLRH